MMKGRLVIGLEVWQARRAVRLRRQARENPFWREGLCRAHDLGGSWALRIFGAYPWNVNKTAVWRRRWAGRRQAAPQAPGLWTVPPRGQVDVPSKDDWKVCADLTTGLGQRRGLAGSGVRLPAALPTRPTAAAAAEREPAGTASRSPPQGPIYVTLTTDVLPSSVQRNGVSGDFGGAT